MNPPITLRQALADPDLLGNALVGDSWAVWRVILIAAMGEPMTDGELAVFERVTGRKSAPTKRIEEALFLIGRRGGKDSATSVLATYMAALIDWSPVLSAGERGLVVCIGPDQRQSKITRDYIEGVFDSSPLLSKMVTHKTADSIELNNRISIEVRAASFRRLRGVTSVAVIATEAAFWNSDETSENADTAILTAVRPSLATTRGPLIVITTPYSRKGEVWDLYSRHYGPNGDPAILVAQGASTTFNPSLPQSVVDRALERDHAAASAEYLAVFRSDIESFVSRDAVEGCVMTGRLELPPQHRLTYSAFVDPAGGSGSDAMTLCIAHIEDEVGVVDAIREVKPPFSTEATVTEFAQLMRSYRVNEVVGDRYAGSWPTERFSVHGITYRPSERTKTQIYVDALAGINGGRFQLLDNTKLINQLCALERRTTRGTGRDIVDHPPSRHDDVANAVCGALLIADEPQCTLTVMSLDEVFRQSNPDHAPETTADENYRLAEVAYLAGSLRPKDIMWVLAERQRRATRARR